MKVFFRDLYRSFALFWMHIREFSASYLHSQFVLFSSIRLFLDLEGKETSFWDGRKLGKRKTHSHLRNSIYWYYPLPNTTKK
ncbi:hypothetical protein KAS50_03275 [bacterium]|nr:hypothetical protein [bacterium]